jgi:hypothetical protein
VDDPASGAFLMRRSRHVAPRARVLATALALTVIGPALLAGAAGAGSVYSVGGLGEPTLEEGARLRALGGAGAAEHGPRVYSLANPASIAEAERLVLEATILPSMRRVDAARGPDETGSETLIPSLRGLIALPGRLVLGGAYLQGTDASFRIDRDETVGTPSHLKIDGSGGINFVRVTVARRILPAFQVGIDYDVVAGSYREEWTRTFGDSALATSRDTLETTYAKQGRWRLGGQFLRGGVSVGAVYETKRRLPLTFRQRTAGAVVTSSGKSLTIPAGWILGISAPVGGRYRVVGQYRRADWNNASLESDVVAFRAEERYSLGVERAAPTEEGGGTLHRLPLRVGGYVLRWPDRLPLAGASDVSGGTAGVDEFAVSLGTGFMSQDRGGAIDLSLEAGGRGNRGDLGVRERFIRFAISLQVSDDTWKGTFHPRQ